MDSWDIDKGREYNVGDRFRHRVTITVPATLVVRISETGWRGTGVEICNEELTDAVYEQLEAEITELTGHPLRPESRKPAESEETAES